MVIAWGRLSVQKIKITMYSFIHIPKTGGTAIIEYLQKNYSDIFICSRLPDNPYHSLMAKDVDNPICIIRDPYDRFLSAYSYWRYGPMNGPWVAKYNNHKNSNIELDDFIDQIQIHKELLNTSITWQLHFKPQSYWIRSEDYNKSIIIKYKKDLTKSVCLLLDFLNISYKKFYLAQTNNSKVKTNIISDKAIKYINDNYVEDFQLIDKLNTRQDIFRFVI